VKPVDPSRTMAVQYVKYPLGTRALETLRNARGPIVVGVKHPAYTAEIELTRETLASLCEDLE
jgi:hypothetical protein